MPKKAQQKKPPLKKPPLRAGTETAVAPTVTRAGGAKRKQPASKRRSS